MGAVRHDPPVREVLGRVAAVVLAAGSSSRMGQAKQLLPWARGGTVIGTVVQGLQASGLSEIVVVVGQGREAVEGAVVAALLGQTDRRCALSSIRTTPWPRWRARWRWD